MRTYNYNDAKEILNDVYHPFANYTYTTYTVVAWDSGGYECGMQVKLHNKEEIVELWEYSGSGYDPYVQMITNDPNIICKILLCLPPKNECGNYSYYYAKEK